MELTKDTYTKDEVYALIQPMEKEISDLKALQVEATKAIEKVKELEKANLTNTIKLEMTRAGIDESMFDLVDAEDIEKSKAKITKLVELKKTEKVDGSYKPNNHKSNNEYETAEKEKNTEKMISSKLSKLFT